MSKPCCPADFHLAGGTAAFRGPLADAARHAHLAWKWMASLDGTASIVVEDADGHRLTGSVFVVPGGASHRVLGSARVAALWFDPARARRHPEFIRIGQIQSLDLDAEGRRHLAAFATARDEAAFRESAERLGGIVIGTPSAGADGAIEAVLARLAESGADRPTLAELALRVGLGERTLRTRFVAQVGTTFRAYRLWGRLVTAVEAIRSGASITDAAHAAGFADGAHFSRTFHRQFGLAPVMVAPVIRGPDATPARNRGRGAPNQRPLDAEDLFMRKGSTICSQ